MKNLWALVFVVLILIVLGLFLFSFQVRETEKALVTLFGDPVKTVTEPGWYFKWPRPIHDVYHFDARSHLYETVLEETPTKGGKPINVTTYVVWKIGDPQMFRETVKDTRGAEEKLEGLLRNRQNSVIGRYSFSDFVNSDKTKIKLEEIEREMGGDAFRDHAAAEYGIEIKLVGISRLGISEQTSKDVFARMSADRRRKTEQILADGNAEAAKIRKDAESKRKELLAIVEAQGKAIRGSGDAEAAKHYEVLAQETEFAMFLREMESSKKIFSENSTILIGADSDVVRFLKEMPDIKPEGGGN